MNDAIAKVRQFQIKTGIPVADNPTALSKDVVDVQRNLLQEELNEFETACVEGDFLASVDALADMLYLILGAVNEMGLHRHFSLCFDEVHLSNMSKEADMSLSRKVVKGDAYFPPDLRSIIFGASNGTC